MPIYDYVCSACRHRFEVFHGLNESGPHQCPVCEGPVTRAFAPPTILFKGSGWAKMDRRATSAPSKKGGSDRPASGTSSPAEGAGSGTTGATGATDPVPAAPGAPAAPKPT